MRSSAIVVKQIASALLLATGLVMLGGQAQTARATDSMIDVRVCGSESTATISIVEPESDSNLSQQPVVIKGQVNDVSQVTVTVDGAYSHSLAIARGQTQYETPVALSSGTHTVEVTGSDVCAHADPTASVVVTYTPAVPPSSGDDTPTDVGDSSSSGGVIVGSNFPGSNLDPAQPASPDWLTSLPAPIRQTIRATDLQTVAQDGVAVGIVRVVTILAGLTLIVGAGVLSGWFKSKHSLAAPYRRLLMLQFVGLCLIVLALIL